MSRYLDEAAALADGFTIDHESDRQRFVVREADEVVGEAHYSLLTESMIDFDHTFVVPRLRNTGLSGLLAHRAVTDEIVQGKQVRASCWFIAGYLRDHPELVQVS